MSTMEEVTAGLQKLLEESYELGRAAGEDAAYQLGRMDGYEEAVEYFRNALQSIAKHGPEGSTEDTPKQPKLDAEAGKKPNTELFRPKLAPSLQRAFDYVCAHPGTTAQAAIRDMGGGNGVFYRLANLGLIDRHQTAIGNRKTSHFYPMEQTHG